MKLASFPGNDPNRDWTQQPGPWGSRDVELLLTENGKVPIQTERSSDVTLHSHLHLTTGFTAGTGGVQPPSKDDTAGHPQPRSPRTPADAQRARPLSPCPLPSIPPLPTRRLTLNIGCDFSSAQLSSYGVRSSSPGVCWTELGSWGRRPKNK